MYDNDYVEEKETKHHQLRWVIKTKIGGILRQQEFAHPLAAQDALVLAGEHRAAAVPPHVTLRVLRMLAYESLEGSKELSAGELEDLRTVHVRLEQRRAPGPRVARTELNELIERRFLVHPDELRRLMFGDLEELGDGARGGAAPEMDEPEEPDEEGTHD
jgi:hypothetical protein